MLPSKLTSKKSLTRNHKLLAFLCVLTCNRTSTFFYPPSHFFQNYTLFVYKSQFLNGIQKSGIFSSYSLQTGTLTGINSCLKKIVMFVTRWTFSRIYFIYIFIPHLSIVGKVRNSKHIMPYVYALA